MERPAGLVGAIAEGAVLAAGARRLGVGTRGAVAGEGSAGHRRGAEAAAAAERRLAGLTLCGKSSFDAGVVGAHQALQEVAGRGGPPVLVAPLALSCRSGAD